LFGFVAVSLFVAIKKKE